ncbi:MAG: phosphatase PAP2 family protein [Patescibacteria group bacterium]|nr:phosphatase PAP2 family protein [Patescibacteria group bacterium]
MSHSKESGAIQLVCDGGLPPPSASEATVSPYVPFAGGLRLQGWTAWRWLPLALLALAAVALSADCAIAQWFPQRHYPSILADLIQLSEVFGHGVGVILLAVTIYHLDVGGRFRLPRLLLCSLGAGMAANGVKMLLARTRPRYFEFDGDVLATFSGWLPLGRGGSAVQSFPSGHTATAVGLAVVLSCLYPRGRRLFAALAILVACQRMQSGSHYLSDVLVAAAVGMVVARAFLEPGWLARQIERLEARWQRQPTPSASESGPRLSDAA